MTHVTDARELLVKARLELGRAVVKTDDGKEANILFDAAGHVRKALDLLNLISQQQQTDDVVRIETHATLEKRKWVYDVRTMSDNPVWVMTHSVWVAIADDGASCLLRNGTAALPGDRIRIGDDLRVIASMEPHGPLFVKATFTQQVASPQQTGDGANLSPAGDQE